MTIKKPLLKLGSINPTEVKVLQQSLTNWGVFNSTIDGDFGPLTESAVKSFQSKKGLIADGEVGAKTWSLLLKETVEIEVADTKTNVENVLKIARSYIGYKESPPGSNRTKFGEWYGMNGVPWCAQFLSYIFNEAGCPLPPIQSPKGVAYCPFVTNYYKNLGKFNKTPKVGSLVLFDWGKDGVADHIGIVEKVINSNTVQTIEGNTSASNNSNGGQVMRRMRYVNGGIQGFAHVL